MWYFFIKNISDDIFGYFFGVRILNFESFCFIIFSSENSKTCHTLLSLRASSLSFPFKKWNILDERKMIKMMLHRTTKIRSTWASINQMKILQINLFLSKLTINLDKPKPRSQSYHFFTSLTHIYSLFYSINLSQFIVNLICYKH